MTEKSTNTYRAEVFISLKPLVNDPEGLEIRNGLHSLGYDSVQEARSGKYIQLTVAATSADEAQQQVEEMCEKLLANTVIEQ
ncbi:MAG: phosphoribosylformylglycinamidine synthase subunit PurS, partial [Chloroflexota bacterium]